MKLRIITATLLCLSSSAFAAADNYPRNVVERPTTLAKGDIQNSIHSYSLALNVQENTQETFFIKTAYEVNISNYFRLGENDSALSLVNELQEKFPKHQIKSNIVNAFIAYQNDQYPVAIVEMFKQIDHEIDERRLFLKNAVQSTALLNSQNITELDKQFLEKTIEIQELNIKNAQSDKNTIYLFLVFALLLVIGISIFSFYLFFSGIKTLDLPS